MANSEEYNGVQKAAILLIALGPEKSASIFKHLKEEEIEELTLEIANTRSISPQTKEDVLNEFYQVCLAQQYIAEGGIGYAKELLEKALGEEKAQGVISKLTASLQVRPFEFVRKTDPAQLLNFIQDEHPQTIAMILSYLSAGQSAMIIGSLVPEKQADVAKRIALMDRTSPDVIKEVERVLERKLSTLVNQDYTIVGGVDAIVSILNTVDRSTEKHIMETLEIEEPELADEESSSLRIIPTIFCCASSTSFIRTGPINSISSLIMVARRLDIFLKITFCTSSEAEEILAEARSRAEAVLAQANEQAVSIRKQAEENGYETGYNSGVQEGNEKAAAELAVQRSRMEEEQRRMEEEYRQKIEELEPYLVDIVADVFEKVFHVQFDDKKEILIYLIQQTILSTEGTKDFQIRVSLKDYEYVETHKNEITEQVGGAVNVEVMADASLKERQCMIETDSGIFDCGSDVQLEHLIKALRSLSL